MYNVRVGLINIITLYICGQVVGKSQPSPNKAMHLSYIMEGGVQVCLLYARCYQSLVQTTGRLAPTLLQPTTTHVWQSGPLLSLPCTIIAYSFGRIKQSPLNFHTNLFAWFHASLPPFVILQAVHS